MEILNFKGPLSDLIYILKKGGSIRIKKKNRGKFTESAKRAGMGVQEYARHVLANKDKYSSTLVKRANFARNAKKFKHEDGGIIKYQNPSSPLINRVNKSKANFVQRLLDPNRKHIQNWVNPLSISTHKLGWATEDTKQGAFVYPEIQEINGELVDFTNPIYRRSEGINSAVERRDTVRMTPEQAKWFTENYKQYYPEFKDGGILKAQKGTENLYAPHPLGPVGIALNQAKATVKMEGEQQHLPLGVREVAGPDGKKVAIRTEQPLVPLEQSIAEWLPGTGDVAEVGYIADDVKNGRYGSAALAAGLMFLPGAAARKVIDLNGIKKVNVKLEDPTKYWYVAHQTGSSNFSKIAQDGLQTGSGLNGTALYLTEEYMDDFANGRLKQKHLSHEGADGLVVMKFPKDKFPSGDLDDISIRLMDLGESNSFEVPSEYLQFFKRDQLKKGGKL